MPDLAHQLIFGDRQQKLIDFLRENKGVQPTRFIFETVWHDKLDGLAGDTIVRVTIYHIRSKYAKLGRQSPIHTVHGQGYYFSEVPSVKVDPLEAMRAAIQSRQSRNAS